jgi:tRNA(His) guanylyltransferase
MSDLAFNSLDSNKQASSRTPPSGSPPTGSTSSDPPPPAHWTNRKLQPKKGKNRQPDLPFDGTSGKVVVLHVDLIKDGFWNERPWLLA